MKPLLLASFLLFSGHSWSQDLVWAKGMGGTGSDYATHSAVDKNGNIYTIGAFSNTADFDPGAGTYNLTATGVHGLFILKLDVNGNFIRAKSFGGNTWILGAALAVSPEGKIYITGRFAGSASFNPDPAVPAVVSGGDADVFVLKLDSAFNFMKVSVMQGSTSFHYGEAVALLLDGLENIYTSGDFRGTADFDPGPGVFNSSADSDHYDVYILKLDSGLNLQWMRRMGGPRGDLLRGMALDSRANIYTCGAFQDVADYDPGVSTFNLTASGNADAFLSKLDSSGKFVWVRQIGGDSADSFSGVSISPSGKIFLSGYFENKVDFDPGPGQYFQTAGGWGNGFYLALDTSANFLWAGQLVSLGFGWPHKIVADSRGDLYVAGDFRIPMDFDPGPDTAILRPRCYPEFFVLKLDSNGNFMWVRGMGNTGQFWVRWSIALDQYDNIYMTGGFKDAAVLFPDYNAIGLASAGVYDALILKICPGPEKPGKIYGPTSFCPGSAAVYFITPVPGALGYEWKVPPGAIIDSGQNSSTIHVTFGSDTGKVSVAAINSCSIGIHSTLQVKLKHIVIGAEALPNDTVCRGTEVMLHGTGASTYSWSGGISDSIAFLADSTTIWTVIGTDVNGCKDSAEFGLTVNPLPAVGGTVTPNGPVCKGTQVTLQGTGASTYSWSGGISNGSPFYADTTTTWSVKGIDLNGCEDSAQFTLTVNPLPVVIASVSPPEICEGEMLTYTVSGALTYEWLPERPTGSLFKPGKSHTYTVTGTDASGCKDTASITIKVNHLPRFFVQPADRTVPTGVGLFLIVATAPGVELQWQQETPSGFADLVNGWDFYGVNNDSLLIYHSVTSEPNIHRFRCRAKEGDCQDVSRTATLIVKNKDEFLADDAFIIYPNPAEDFIKINVGLNLRGKGFSIADATGRTVLQGTLDAATTTVDLTSVAAGVYFIRLGELNKAVKVVMSFE